MCCCSPPHTSNKNHHAPIDHLSIGVGIVVIGAERSGGGFGRSLVVGGGVGFVICECASVCETE